MGKREYLSKEYDTLDRFMSYHYQIESVLKSKPKKVLIIGVGNNLVGEYLKKKGIKIVTCDIDSSVNPDYLGDIRALPFRDRSFDAVLACQILEHIPFQDVEKALSELSRVSKKSVVISIPYSCFNLNLIMDLHIPFIKRRVELSFKVPYFLIKLRVPGEHFWEMGRRGYPKNIVRNKIMKNFRIIREFQPILNSYHYFFILEKKPY